MITAALTGATIQEVYYAVNHPHWVPVIGVKFTSEREAREYAEDAVSANSPRALIETRVVFAMPPSKGGGTVDTVVERQYTEYETVIRRLSED